MNSIFSLKNVDAGAAKELMVYLVNLQSDLAEVNKYVSHVSCNILLCKVFLGVQ